VDAPKPRGRPGLRVGSLPTCECVAEISMDLCNRPLIRAPFYWQSGSAHIDINAHPRCAADNRLTADVDEVAMNSTQIAPAERRLAWTIDTFSNASGICRSVLYQDIRDGKLRAVKRGRATLILDHDGHSYLNSLPAIDAKAA
jgi:hypothetical protein